MKIEQAIEILKENKRALEETFPIMPKCYIDKYEAITTILNHIESDCKHKNTYDTPTSKHGVKGVHTRCQDCQNIVSTTYEN